MHIGNYDFNRVILHFFAETQWLTSVFCLCFCTSQDYFPCWSKIILIMLRLYLSKQISKIWLFSWHRVHTWGAPSQGFTTCYSLWTTLCKWHCIGQKPLTNHHNGIHWLLIDIWLKCLNSIILVCHWIVYLQPEWTRRNVGSFYVGNWYLKSWALDLFSPFKIS